jgi:tetratricopeptide (TPR) repeat protein
MRSAHSPRSFVVSFLRTGFAVLIAGGMSASTAYAQIGVGPQAPAGPSLGAGPTQESKPTLSPADQTIKEAFQKTRTAAGLDDFSAIISLCQDGLNQGTSAENAAYAHKLQAWAHNKRGEKYADLHNDKQAMEDFEAAIKLDPKLWKAIHNRGVSKASLSDIKGAMSDFDQVVRLNPDYANAWYNRGELKYDQGDFAGALADYNRAIGIEPRDAGFYNSRGHTQYRLGRLREALSDYNRAVGIDPNNAAALVNRGDAYREQAIYGPAASDYREAIRLDPKLGRAYLSAAWLMATCPDQRYRNTDMAIKSAQKAIELDGDKDYRYLDTLAAAHANAGDFDQAKSIANKAVNATPQKEMANVRQRLELYQSGRPYREGASAEPVRSASAVNRMP